MKELNSVEMQNVSGAGLFSDVFGSVLGGITSTASAVIGGIDWTSIQNYATTIGQNVGLVIDNAFDTVKNKVDSFFSFFIK
ncbi:hypothetical protein [Tatumella ptyseos]|uniref:hypothetical protein n=1 Tax=Tatumella ptyseos TaxID=82987 RepID=UPI0026ECE269|nr:hypothetical protein [Tatumella ptyseos]WKX26568.1 hypothetical protein QJR74_15145 [Tatumella ptyseos]